MDFPLRGRSVPQPPCCSKVNCIFYSDLYSIYNNNDQQEMQLVVALVGAGQDAKSKLMVFGFLYLFENFLNRNGTSNYLPHIYFLS